MLIISLILLQNYIFLFELSRKGVTFAAENKEKL